MSDIEISAHEAALILALDGADTTRLESLATTAELEIAQARSAIERLKLKDAFEMTREDVTNTVRLSDLGEDFAKNGLPEIRLWQTLAELGSQPMKALQNREDLDRKQAGAAFGALKKAKAVVVDRGDVRLVDGADRSEWDAQQTFLSSLLNSNAVEIDSLTEEQRGYLNNKRIKNCFKTKARKTRYYQLTEVGKSLIEAARQSEELTNGPVTREMLADGTWTDARFRRYSIAPPSPFYGGRHHPYREFLDKVKHALTSMGFEEMRGSLVENEFWDMDALFMPQFHPARDIHDVYFIEAPTHAKSISEPHLSNIAAAHEGQESSGSRGWGYVFDKERTRRLVLRSQGTVLSARKLASEPKIPGKYFSIARCFRFDEVDATHAPDFFQIEGIVLSDQMSLRELLGLLKLFATELAEAEDIKAVPAYFPFTEPSVEIHMKHPTKGWIELGGAGIFRPEVSRSLGVDVPVIAWGLGLDRMFMNAAKVGDIRDLFPNNLTNGLKDLRAFNV